MVWEPSAQCPTSALHTRDHHDKPDSNLNVFAPPLNNMSTHVPTVHLFLCAVS